MVCRWLAPTDCSSRSARAGRKTPAPTRRWSRTWPASPPSPPATLEIVAAPRLEIDRPSGNLDLWFPVAPDLGCRVEAAEDAGGGWQPFLEHPVIPSGLLRLRVNTGDGRLRFFRCLHLGTGGSAAGPTGP